MKKFEAMYKEFEKKYNQYSFKCSLEPFEVFLKALHAKEITHEVYAEARRYFGNRWNNLNLEKID